MIVRIEGRGIAQHARAQVRVWRAGPGLGVEERHLNGRGHRAHSWRRGWVGMGRHLDSGALMWAAGAISVGGGCSIGPNLPAGRVHHLKSELHQP